MTPDRLTEIERTDKPLSNYTVPDLCVALRAAWIRAEVAEQERDAAKIAFTNLAAYIARDASEPRLVGDLIVDAYKRIEACVALLRDTLERECRNAKL